MMDWQDISTAPEGVWVIGMRPTSDSYAPAFVGVVDKMRPGSLLNSCTGEWVCCTHWMPIPPINQGGE